MSDRFSGGCGSRYPDPSDVFERMEQRHTRLALESSLARAFTQWRKTADPSKRATLWREIEDAAERLEEMNDE